MTCLTRSVGRNRRRMLRLISPCPLQLPQRDFWFRTEKERKGRACKVLYLLSHENSISWARALTHEASRFCTEYFFMSPDNRIRFPGISVRESLFPGFCTYSTVH